MGSQKIQELIHKMETGAGARVLQYILLAVAVLGLVVIYDIRAYRGFSSPEAMDAAQVARNVEEGRGFSTDFIRPFSLYLVQKHNLAAHPELTASTNATDLARINGAHPDLANPPAYPLLLAGLMKIWTPDWPVEMSKSFWSDAGRFSRYQPEFCIAVLNQLLLLMVVVLTFFLAKKLFDGQVAWLAALLTLGSDLLWKFSVSGLPTMLLLVILLGLVLCLVKAEESGRAEIPQNGKLLTLAIVAGLLTGVGMLTRYSFGVLIVPVAVFLVMFGGTLRKRLPWIAVLAFVLLVSPWIARNLMVSGTLFGTAGYNLTEGTYMYPGSELMQSIKPDMGALAGVTPYTHKFMANFNSILQDGLLSAAGWPGILFFTGLLLGLRNPAARRLRYFTIMSLAILILAQALGKTAVSTGLNSDDLLVWLTPCMVIFGTVFFLTLLDQMKLPAPGVRYGIITLLAVLACQPLIATIFSRTSPVCYPPYYPPEIQRIAGWMKPDELMMSDVPWAVAWYGQRQCAWLTLDAQDDFNALRKIKPVQALYLTPLTMDQKFASECVKGNKRSWGSFIYTSVKDQRLPDHFPLTKMPTGLFPERMFLADRDRWSNAAK